MQGTVGTFVTANMMKTSMLSESRTQFYKDTRFKNMPQNHCWRNKHVKISVVENVMRTSIFSPATFKPVSKLAILWLYKLVDSFKELLLER